MSTRGWYEYYVVDSSTRTVSLAMQFYKWGDATPPNALGELHILRDVTEKMGGRIPVQIVFQLLEENLGGAIELLPRSFPIGCYYFMLQRAADDVLDPFAFLRYAGVTEEERPDFQLAFAVGQAQERRGWHPPHHDDPVVRRAHSSIAVGMLVRSWNECSKDMTFLQWIQYLTQHTKELGLGAFAGHYRRPADVRYIYRFFFKIREPQSFDQRIDAINLELCDGSGRSLDRSPSGIGPDLAEIEVSRQGYEPVSLSQLLRTYALIESPFWEQRLPRNAYLGP